MRERVEMLLLALLLGGASTGLTGCIVVGHSTRGGWFMFPGFGVVLVILLVLLVLRRR